MSVYPPPPPASADTSMSDVPDANGAPVRHVFGSLEAAARSSGMNAATAAAASSSIAAAASPAAQQPVSFNQRSQLISQSAARNDGTQTQTNAKILNPTILAGMAAGNINISAASSETYALSASAQEAKSAQEQQLREMEIKKKSRSVVVPTNDNLVKKRLRELGEPITLFGERIPGRRERLSGILARRAVEESYAAAAASTNESSEEKEAKIAAAAAAAETKENKAYLTPGTEELRLSRIEIMKFSMARTAARIEKERTEREQDNQDASGTRVRQKEARIARLSKFHNFYSEVADSRPIASLAFSSCSTRLATASWSGTSKLWSIVPQTKLQYELKGHKECVTDIAWNPVHVSHSGVNLASCSMDTTVMLWASPDPAASSNDMDTSESTPAAAAPPNSSSVNPLASAPSLTPLAILRGHTDRCCRLAFHPSGRYIASTSFDRTWRLWDVQTQQELVKQQGHTKSTYAIAFQKDGALAATGDLGGVGHLWDLRTGHSILPLVGHAKQMLAADFHPNCVYLATASDDHTVRIWDLRQQRTLYTLGAHSNLISNVRWDPLEGLYLLTSSYDQTSKIWHGTDFTLVKTLAGHEGRVMRAEIAPNGAFIATAAFDRTWKLFAYED